MNTKSKHPLESTINLVSEKWASYPDLVVLTTSLVERSVNKFSNLPERSCNDELALQRECSRLEGLLADMVSKFDVSNSLQRQVLRQLLQAM